MTVCDQAYSVLSIKKICSLPNSFRRLRHELLMAYLKPSWGYELGHLAVKLWWYDFTTVSRALVAEFEADGYPFWLNNIKLGYYEDDDTIAVVEIDDHLQMVVKDTTEPSDTIPHLRREKLSQGRMRTHNPKPIVGCGVLPLLGPSLPNC